MYTDLGNERTLCGSTVSLYECEFGCQYGKRIFCGREWCEYCGVDMSPVHRRRMYRVGKRGFSLVDYLFGLMFTYGCVGYWVFTIPDRLRDKFKSKESLNSARKAITSIIKSYCSSHGFMRWHWFGDGSAKYHPHLNVLIGVDGKLPKEVLDEIRERWRVWLSDYTAIDVPSAVINFQFSYRIAKLFHWSRYVTRATFKDLSWDSQLPEVLFRYKNDTYFGNKDERNIVGSLGREVCDVCLDDMPDVGSVSDDRLLSQGYCLDHLSILDLYGIGKYSSLLRDGLIKRETDMGFLILRGKPCLEDLICFKVADGCWFNKHTCTGSCYYADSG